MELDWPDTATNASNYIVLRSTDGNTYTQIAVLPANAITFNDFGLQPGQFYFYEVEASNSAGVSAPASGFNQTLFLTWNGPTTGGPSSRASHSAVYDNNAQRMIIFGGAGPGLVGDLWQLSLPDPMSTSPVWSPLTASGTPPTPRAGHSAVFDSPNNRMIVFGGQQAGSGPSAYLNDLWILSLVGTPTWTQITSTTGTPPVPRSNHTATYDPIRREMIVFGGTTILDPLIGSILLGDTFVLSLPSVAPFTWSSPADAGSTPCARCYHSAVEDPLGPHMIIFAGLDNDPTNGNEPGGGDGSPLNGETWFLSPNLGYTWILGTFTQSPPLRQGHSAIYDTLNRRMVIFAGGDELFNPLIPDMWALNLQDQSSWSIMPTVGGPSGVFNHSAIYDAKYNRMVIFGGRTGTLTYTNNLWWIVQ
jgi:hypothetical protein